MTDAAKLLSSLVEGHDGLTVVGDIHGDYLQLVHARDHAAAKNHALLFLGDVINRGPYSIPCMVLVRELIEAGRAAFIPGNHEMRARFYMRGEPMSEKDVNRSRRLLAELEGKPDHLAELTRFLETIAACPLWLQAGVVAFAHGGFPESLIDRTPITFEAHRYGPGPAADIAINGDRVPEDPSQVSYTWLDRLSPEMRVYIGHDPYPVPAPWVRFGARGAQLHHLDLGCGRTGGPVGLADLARVDLERWMADRPGRLPAAGSQTRNVPVVSTRETRTN